MPYLIWTGHASENSLPTRMSHRTAAGSIQGYAQGKITTVHNATPKNGSLAETARWLK